MDRATGGRAGYIHIPDMSIGGLREFIRQSMVTIEADSRNADELQRNMSGFAEAFARGAFPRVPTATCATLPQDFQRVYRGMGGAQTLVVTAR